MDVKDAVKIAMEYIADIFESDNATNIGLEEVLFDEHKNSWDVTIGFSRPWDYKDQSPFLAFQQQNETPKRQYKIVQIDNESGKVKSIKIRGSNDE